MATGCKQQSKKPNRDTKHGRSILLQEAKLRKANRLLSNPLHVKNQQEQNVKTIVWIALIALIGLLVYITRGEHGLIRWLNH